MNEGVIFDSRFLRPQKAKWTQEWYTTLEFREDIDFRTYNQAVVFPLKRFPGDNLLFGRGGVNDSSGNYIESSAIKDRVEGSYPIEETALIDETVVYCGYLVNHWGHFLIEAVNRLWFYLENDQPEYRYAFIVDDGEDRIIQGNYKEFFDLLGIQDRIILVNRATRFRNVIIPDISFNYLKFYSRQYQQIFEKVIQGALLHTECTDANPKRVFLSRSAFPKAGNTEFGLDLLDNFFQKNGYEIIYPEQYSLTKLILMLNEAELVATESGSMSHNMLFCSYEQEFIIVERQTIVNRVQTSIDCVKKAKVTYVDADMMIYPVIMGDGPFLMLYNKWFKKFATENNYFPPDIKYTNEDYIKENLKKYFMAYRRRYYLGVGFEGNHTTFIGLLLEGYYDSMDILGKYLNGQAPFCKEQLKEERFARPNLIRRFLMLVRRKVQNIWSIIQST